MTPPLLEAAGITVTLGGKQVLDVPSLAVERGETLVILGPNGSGKSTLLTVLALLLRPTTGTIAYDGETLGDGVNLLPYRRRMAMVFQDPLLLSTSVFQNVALGLRLRGVKGQEARDTVSLWLERFGIGRLAGRSARTLSGGEAQRVSLARAFAVGPEVLFLDEPFASLDMPTRYALTRDFKAALAGSQTTVVMVTHERDEALALAGRVGVMLNGKLAQVDRTEVVFRSPASEEVAGFIGVENVLPGRIVGREGDLAQVQVSDRVLEVVNGHGAGGPVLLCVRPEDVTLAATEAAGPSSARSRLRGCVSRIDDRGSQWRVVVDCGFPLVALVTRQSGQEMELGPGAEVTASFKASAAHLIPR
ncbi:MAG: ABC transporter ATP-binding protein [Chloroflexi bacterium]|nr:ABC transporter ATP-binding protein [Chloroflexota bacterium]